MQVYESAVAIAQLQLQAGNIKLLAVVITKRAPGYPDIPTVAEAGQPALTIDGLVGLFGPPTMPMALRQRIAADIKEVMENDAIIKDRLNATAQLFAPGGPEEFAKSTRGASALIAKNAGATSASRRNRECDPKPDLDSGREPCCVLGAAIALGMTSASALPSQNWPSQNWPTRTVRFILTLGPGSGTDIGGRLLADRLTRKWGQPVVIENKTGGDGLVAIGAFVGAKDDHILLLSPTSSFTAHPFLHDNLPYKPEDLAPIARVSNTFVGITVPVASPANSLNELVVVVRDKPGELNWAGVTGANSFMFEAWLMASKLDMKKVPYRNPVDAGRDLAENRVQVYESAVAIAQPQIELGKIKLLALLNTVRTPAYPHIPTVAEAGQPALTIDGLVGLFGHPFMPMALRERIAADMGKGADRKGVN